MKINPIGHLVKTNPIQTQSKPIFKRMNVNFCVTGYYKSKQKALKKPPLVEFTIFRVSGKDRFGLMF